MTSQDALRSFIQQTLNLQEVTDQSAMGKTHGWDSYGQLTLITAIESHYDVSFEFDQIGEINSVERITDFLKQAGKLSD
ncbi:acyl carrier protein [Magnetococcus sp. PR-3]|uniref:acyl carrier protein n=1 Tax=Magnetococcus sp. PR-3 TaxID=3120355 RepID=UPI002FCE4C43